MAEGEDIYYIRAKNKHTGREFFYTPTLGQISSYRYVMAYIKKEVAEEEVKRVNLDNPEMEHFVVAAGDLKGGL